MLRTAAALAPLALLALAPGLSAEVLNTTEGRFEETILSILPNEKGEPFLKSEKRELALAMVRTIEFNDRTRAIAQESATIILTNGDRLRGQVSGGNEDKLEVRTAALGPRLIPLERIRGLVLDPTLDFREVEKNLRRKSDKDVIFLRSGGEANGVLEKIAKDEIAIDVDQAGSLKIKLDKVRMVLMSVVESPPKIKAGVLVKLRLLDGSAVQGRFLELKDGAVAIEHLLEDKLSVRAADILELLVLNGATLYLSDLEPSKVVQNFPEGFQYYPEIFGWKKDRSVLGGLIKLAGKSYEKGLGVHSHCALTFELGGAYKELRAVIGLDDSVRFLGEPGMGSVRFRVLVDGKPAKEIAEGVLKEKGEDPGTITIDVRGAQNITLIADFGPLLHILGRADWADAHLIRADAPR